MPTCVRTTRLPLCALTAQRGYTVLCHLYSESSAGKGKSCLCNRKPNFQDMQCNHSSISGTILWAPISLENSNETPQARGQWKGSAFLSLFLVLAGNCRPGCRELEPATSVQGFQSDPHPSDTGPESYQRLGPKGLVSTQTLAMRPVIQTCLLGSPRSQDCQGIWV